MSLPARIFSFVFSILLFVFLLSPSVFAQTTASDTNPNVPNNLHTRTQSIMIEVTSALTCLITGVDTIDRSHQCLGVDIKTGKVGYVKNGGGAIGSMGNLLSMTFNPPIHTGDYVNYLAGNFGIAKPAYAQGVGFKSLSPFIDIWIAFRNIAYLILILVFLVIGFAIMFRVHIDPRTVMTVENQIPKIIIGLIFVTFSFAIAGFLIDLMWVACYLVIAVFASIDGSVRTLVTSFQGENVFALANSIQANGLGGWSGFGGIVTNSSGAVKDTITSFAQGWGGTILGDLLVTIGSTVLFTTTKLGGILTVLKNLGPWGNVVGGLITGVAVTATAAVAGQQVLGIIGGLLSLVVISVAVFWALFRLWFSLIKAYIMILLDIVFGPFWVIAGLMPGSRLSFTGWLRDLGGNLISFPATLVMFLLAQIFINKFGTTQVSGQFVPPFIGNPGEPNTMGALIGLGFILLTPAVVDMMRKALKAPDIDLSTIFRGVGVGMGAVNVPGQLNRLGQQTYYMKSFGGTIGDILVKTGFKKPPPTLPGGP